jgi:hypothetical protein
VVRLGSSDEPLDLLILSFCSHFHLLAHVIRLEVWRLEVFGLDFGVVVYFGFEGF